MRKQKSKFSDEKNYFLPEPDNFSGRHAGAGLSAGATPAVGGEEMAARPPCSNEKKFIPLPPVSILLTLKNLLSMKQL
jgi:hypothetical protein